MEKIWPKIQKPTKKTRHDEAHRGIICCAFSVFFLSYLRHILWGFSGCFGGSIDLRYRPEWLSARPPALSRRASCSWRSCRRALGCRPRCIRARRPGTGSLSCRFCTEALPKIERHLRLVIKHRDSPMSFNYFLKQRMHPVDWQNRLFLLCLINRIPRIGQCPLKLRKH